MRSREKQLLASVLIAVGCWTATQARAQDGLAPEPEWCPRCGTIVEPNSIHVPPPPRRRGLFGFWRRPQPCCTQPMTAGEGLAPLVPTFPGMPPMAANEPMPVSPSQIAPEAAQTPSSETTSPTAENGTGTGTAPPATDTSGGAPATDTSGGAPATDTTGAAAAGLGGALASRSSPVNMFGDLMDLQFRPGAPPEPPPGRGPSSVKSAALSPTVRDFKIADNQTAFPVNRFTYNFNYYDNINQSVNQRFNEPLNRVQGMQSIFGFEKMFLDGRASFGMRLPLNSLWAQSNVAGIGHPSTSLGDLSMYLKYAFWMDRDAGRVFSGGMAVTAPTGPAAFGGAPYLRAVHYTLLQPYLAFQYTWDKVYMIGFTAVDVPTGPRDVTMFYNDLGIGYFLFRRETGLIRSIAPIFECHVNDPLNHRDVFNPRDISGTADVVNLTEGLNIFFARRTVLSLGVVEPVTGPRPFSLEALALLNVYF